MAENENFVQIYDNTIIQQVKEYLVHDMLKGGWCIHEAKCHDSELEGTIATRESCLVLVLHGNWERVIPVMQIQVGKAMSPSHPL